MGKQLFQCNLSSYFVSLNLFTIWTFLSKYPVVLLLQGILLPRLNFQVSANGCIRAIVTQDQWKTQKWIHAQKWIKTDRKDVDKSKNEDDLKKTSKNDDNPKSEDIPKSEDDSKNEESLTNENKP